MVSSSFDIGNEFTLDGQLELECGVLSLALIMSYIITFDDTHQFQYTEKTLEKLRNFLFVQWASAKNHTDIFKSVFLKK